jgi:cyanophycinase
VFFPGGDQNHVMDVLKDTKDPEDTELFDALRRHYEAEVVFGGTSAGAAIMSDPMITGKGDLSVIDGAQVEIRPGLGLLPGVIVDQHFIRRQRENRLFGLILKHRDRPGVGIDEDTALLVSGNCTAQVCGSGQVMMIEAQGQTDNLLLQILKDGESFDLIQRRRMA